MKISGFEFEVRCFYENDSRVPVIEIT